MKKMMTYSEANSVLGSSLSPKNRCLSKAVAIANDANPDLLTGFTNNRLVPASAIEPATHVEVQHFFCDANGNNLGTDYTINVPEGQGAYVFYTRILIDGQAPSKSLFEKNKWSGRISNVYEDSYFYTIDTGGGAEDSFCYMPCEIDSNGIIRHISYADDNTGKIEEHTSQWVIHWNESAKQLGIDTDNTYPITLTVNPTKHSNYSISKTVLYFGQKPSLWGYTQEETGLCESITITGFTNPTISRVLKNNNNIYAGDGINTNQWFTSAYIKNNLIFVIKTEVPGDGGNISTGTKRASSLYVDVYKISDSNKTLYLKVDNGIYREGYIQPGLAGDLVYRIAVENYGRVYDHLLPGYENYNYFLISDGSSTRMDINSPGIFFNFRKYNSDPVYSKAKFVVISPSTQQYIDSTDWFDIDTDPIGEDYARSSYTHNIITNNDAITVANNAISLHVGLLLVAYSDDESGPNTIYISTELPI